MKNKWLLVGVAFAALLIVVFSVLDTQQSTNNETVAPPAVSYYEQLRQARQAKDKVFRSSEESPILNEVRANFKGLTYFEPDSSFRIKARLTKFETGTEMNVKMTKGELEKYRPFGKAMFEREGQIYTLLLLKSSGNEEAIFLIFKDLTNGKETYGGGRYLDIPLSAVAGDSLTLDFNLCYNPFCAYNYEYTCPIPPEENHLKIAIRAGEKQFSSSH